MKKKLLRLLTVLPSQSLSVICPLKCPTSLLFDFPVRVLHAGQPVTCSICHKSGHLPRDCPFSGLWLRCKQPGHMARDCPQPWGPSSSSSKPPVPTSSAPVSTVLRAVFVVICTRFHYPVYACAIRSVIRYCPVHFCVWYCQVSGTYYS